jgi:hypothetical protein
MDRFSPYEYLAYLLPGGVVVFAAWIAVAGWPASEPGATGLVVLLSAAFVVGHGIASVASWLEPLAWGHLPGQRANPLWGLFGHRGRYPDDERKAIEADFQSRIRSQSASFEILYGLGYTKLQQLKLDAHLQVLNQQIGFSRNTATACIVAVAVHGVYLAMGEAVLPAWPWLLLYTAGLVLFTARYRRFWVHFADAVVRGVRLLDVPKAGT